MRNVKNPQPSGAPEPSSEGNGDFGALAKLVRAAGPRLDPPRERRERAHVAVRGEWMRVAKARQRRRYMVWAIATAAAAMVALATLPSVWRMLNTPSAEVVAKIDRATGTASIVLDSARREAKPGDEIRTGEVFETPKGIRAAIQVNGGASLRIDGGSRLRALSAGTFQLEEGAVYVDSGGKAGNLEIRTAFGDTRDIGTQFEVRLDGKLTVRVREGKVELKRGAEKAAAAAGEELTATPKAAIARAQVPLNGPLWDWAAELAPAFKMDGKPAKAFLEWLCREKGWTLKFADAKSETAAANTTLHGSLEGSNPDASLDAVLAVSGFSYRVKDGVLSVSLGE